MKSWMHFFPANHSHEKKKKSFSDCLLCMNIFAQNATLILGNSDPFLLIKVEFSDLSNCEQIYQPITIVVPNECHICLPHNGNNA